MSAIAPELAEMLRHYRLAGEVVATAPLKTRPKLLSLRDGQIASSITFRESRPGPWGTPSKSLARQGARGPDRPRRRTQLLEVADFITIGGPTEP